MKNPIDPSVWGQFGDFVGGTLGIILSLISVMLVVWTFKTQNRTAETQRFNDLFFELLKVFQFQEKELQFEYINADGESIETNNKDFFEAVYYQMYKEFQPATSFSQNRKNAIKVYINVAIKEKAKLSLCYKTLFQLLSLVENGNISRKDKVEYLKILRSQFTESELLCIRYHIKSGDYRKFAYLVNKSNLMKHLALFELLEFKYWKERLQPIELKLANDFFISLFKAVRNNECHCVSSDNSLDVKIINTQNSLRLDVVKAHEDSSWFSHYSIHEFENLCEGIIKELVMFSNYSCYNNYKELYFSSAKTIGNIVTVEVKNKKRGKIRLVYDDTMKLEDIVKIF